jgi:hypothetical protein
MSEANTVTGFDWSAEFDQLVDGFIGKILLAHRYTWLSRSVSELLA